MRLTRRATPARASRRVPALRVRSLPPGGRVSRAGGTAGSASGWRSSRQIVELHGGTVGVDSRGVQAGVDLLGDAARRRSASASRSAARVRRRAGHAQGRRHPDRRRRNAMRASCWWRCCRNTARACRAVGSAAAALAILTRRRRLHARCAGVGCRDARDRRLRAESEIRSRVHRSGSGQLPAIAVTAYANPEDRVRALVAGYQNHMPKPVDANALAASIAKLVAQLRRLSGARTRSLLGFGLGLGVGLPVLRRLRARL